MFLGGIIGKVRSWSSSNWKIETMAIPLQASPINRYDIIAPHSVIDLRHKTREQLIGFQMDLLDGANFNDP